MRYVSEHLIVSVDALVEKELGEHYFAHRDGLIFFQESTKPYPTRVGEWYIRNNEIVLLVKA